MARKKKLQVQEEISPNLIPMIDIMFLLLLFFMLGADMGQRELEEVELPKALTVKEEKEGATDESDKLVVNVYHYSRDKCPAYSTSKVCREKTHWKIGIKGRDFSDLKKLEEVMRKEADPFRAGSLAAAPTGPSTGQALPPSERKVLIRGDAYSPYGYIQEVVNTCAKVGIYKVECGAARPPDADAIEAGAAGAGPAPAAPASGAR